MSHTDKPVINFKQGDDFSLAMIVTDTNNATAIAAKITLVDAESVYADALAANPQIASNVTATLEALETAQAAYDLAILTDITGWTITSKIAWCGKLVDTFTVTITDASAGEFTISIGNAATVLWKPRKYEVDIQFDRTAGKVSSETFIVDVERGITSEL